MTRDPFVPERRQALGPGREFDRIRGIARQLGAQGIGLGDDCGLIRVGDEFFALSTDVSVEEVHFRLDWIGLAEVGWRAAAAALSDLAAEGAEPVGILCAVTLPTVASDSDLLEVISGVKAAAQFAGASVLGGDLSSGPVWSLAITVLGRTRGPITRGGAKPEDQIWVTGRLGGARAALEAWRRDDQPLPGARASYAHPEPRIAAGRWLAQHGAHAMIDLSDGLGGDAAHLAAASGVALKIDLDAVPVASEVFPEAQRKGLSAQQFAAEGGEDFELLVALPPRFDSAEACARESGILLTRIGAVGEGRGVHFFMGGRSIELRGFNHFG